MKNFIYEKIGKMLGEIENRIYGASEVITGYEYCECGYKTANMPPRGQRWSPVADKFSMGNKEKEQHAWVRGKIVIPEELVGKSVSLCNLSFDTDKWGKAPQLLIYIDGKMVGAFDHGHKRLDIDSTVREHDLLLYCYTDEKTTLYELKLSVCEVREEVKKLYYDICVPYQILEYTNENSREYCRIRDVLSNALDIVNFSVSGDEFISTVSAASAYLEENLYKKYAGNDVSCVCVGHTHIDVAWLWTFAQTREKVQRSFSTVVSLMKKYPEYKFMSSQAQLYKFVKEDAPELYEEIKKLVSEGRWEVEGAMWVEADCNLPSGESLVRQIIYGKRFFKDEFNVDCKVLWLPDVFGYSATLPQILKKSGVDYFVTSKISWNEFNCLPYDFFKWKGIDGSDVLTYFITTQRMYDDGEPKTYTTYNGSLEPTMVAGAYNRFQQKDISDEIMMPYGWGDGGGGPTDAMIEKGLRMTGGLPGCPKTKFGFAGKFLDDLRENTKDKKVPEWNGELYLEYHRGTYTSQAKNKKNNRKSEYIYRNAELYSVIGELLCGVKYPKTALMEGWEKILLCQFHDVLPGSSIRPVYDDTDAIYPKVMGDGKAISAQIKEAIAKGVKTYGGLLVFNPNSFETSAEVMAEGEWRYVEKIPALGWAVVPPADKIVPEVDGRKIENDFLIVEFDENMNISRIFDKKANREVLKSGEVGNGLYAFEDYPRAYDAWEITNYYKDKKYPINDVVACERYECGEKAGFVVTRRFRNSAIRQIITLDGHTSNIGFDTEIDWHEEHILLKAAFPFDINATSATYDVQFGYVERPTHSNTEWDAAKFEVCAHKYADISERGYGVSLINDCKYGHSAEGSTLSLTLLKCATHPDPNADKGHHRFTYTLYPHMGDFASAGTVENAYILNNPLECVPMSRQDGALPEKFALIKIDGSGVFIDTVKKSEDGDGIIVRLYDAVNSRGTHTLTFGMPISSAYVCDLLENELSELNVDGKNVKIDVKPFEIVTLKIKM